MKTENTFPNKHNSKMLRKAIGIVSMTYYEFVKFASGQAKDWLEHKRTHVINVLEEMRNILLTEDEVLKKFTYKENEIALASAALHDLARFMQVVDNKKTPDTEFDHAAVAVDFLEDDVNSELLNNPALFFAIEEHNKEKIDYQSRFLENMSDKDKDTAITIAKLLRDVDKLENIKHFVKSPDIFLTDIPNGKPSENMKQALATKDTIGLELIQNQSDAIIYGLGWVWDVNFNTTKQEIEKVGFIEKGLKELEARGVSKEELSSIKKHITFKTLSNDANKDSSIINKLGLNQKHL